MNDVRINIKPLSVNLAWQGRRYKTKEYKTYENNLLLMLPKLKIPKTKLKIFLVYGLTHVADLDNPTKLILDIFQKKYHFDDNMIYELNIKKVLVKSGHEFLEFKIHECK
jgi:Holliday junction resolvase RusA-like endonuclease